MPYRDKLAGERARRERRRSSDESFSTTAVAHDGAKIRTVEEWIIRYPDDPPPLGCLCTWGFSVAGGVFYLKFRHAFCPARYRKEHA